MDGTDTSTWLAEKPGASLTVDLGRRSPSGSIALTRPPVLAIANGETGTDSHARTGPTRSAGSLVSVSTDGRRWRRLARLKGGALRETVAGAGRSARYVRVVAARGASARHPLVVGELTVKAR